MRAAYFDMLGGASGNMLLGALVDAGGDFNAVVRILETIPVQGWTIACERVERRGQRAIYIDVVVPGEDDHFDHPEAHRHPAGKRTLADVLQLFERSQISSPQREIARRIAERLSRAEGTDRFHPVGQIDAILDIAATCIALEQLGVEQVFCSPFPVGLRSPAATERLLGGAPRRHEEIDMEMVTTTGAAILTTLVARPGERPKLRRSREGYGAGRSDFPIPNVTRVEIGEL